MAFCYKSTFLRSSILEDPFCLGDLMGPEDVLRIENSFPDLFELPDFASSSHQKSPVSRYIKSSIGIGPRSKSTTALPKVTTQVTKSATTILPKSTLRAISPFEKLSQPTVGCNRQRCQVQTRPVTVVDPVRKFVRPPVQKANVARSNRIISDPPPPSLSPLDQKSAFTRTNQVISRSPSPPVSFSFSSPPPPLKSVSFNFSQNHNGMQLKDQRQILKEEEQENYLTDASINRCEQLLLAKLLASKYENDGKFQKPAQAYSQKKEECYSTYKPVHQMLLDNFQHQNKSFEALLENYPSVLERIARELIHAEVAKIMHEEEENLEGMRKTKKVNVGVETMIRYPDRKTTTNKRLETEKGNYCHISYKEKGTNVDRGRAFNSDDDDSYSTGSSSESLKTIATPDLTPPYKPKFNLQISNPPSKSQDDDPPNCNVPTPSLSKPSALPFRPETVNPKVLHNKLTKENDVTDCSDLEDFVASESIVQDAIFNWNQHVELKISEEEGIVNIPTPIFSSPTSNSLSEIARGRNTELVKQCPGSAGVIGNLNRTVSTPVSRVSTNQGESPTEPKSVIIKNKKNDQTDKSEKECEDGPSSMKSGRKSNSVNFDTSEIHSSMASVLDTISEGELIVPTGEKSPGEISCTFNISPGMHFYRSSTSGDSTNDDDSTYGFE